MFNYIQGFVPNIQGFVPSFLTNENSGNLFNSNTGKTKKEIIRELKGFEKQLIAASNSIDVPEMKKFYNTEANGFRERIKLILGSVKGDKKNFSMELQALISTCKEHLTAVQQSNENQQTTTKEKLENLKDYTESFWKNHEYNLQLFKEAVIKIKSWQNKILEAKNALLKDTEETTLLVDDVERKAKSVLKGFISSEVKSHFKKATDRKIQFERLKFDWLDSQTQYCNVEDLLQYSMFNLMTLPKVADHYKKLEQPKTYFNSLRNSLENFSTHVLAKDFLAKYKPGKEEELVYKRNLNPFFTGIREYKEELKKLGQADKIIGNLNNTRDKLLPEIESKLLEISKEIGLIAERDYSALPFVDETTNLALTQQKETSIQALKLLRKEIEQKWNQFCKDLYQLNHQKIIFKSFQNVSEKMGWCFIMAEHIQGNLRGLRLTENNRKSHELIFTNLMEDYTKLCKLVLETNGNNRQEQIKMLDVTSLEMPVNQECFFNLATISGIENSSNALSDTSTLRLETEYTKAMKVKETFSKIYSLKNLSEEETKVEEMAKTIGLLWTDETKDEVIQSFSDQRIQFANDVQQHKTNIDNAYKKTLPSVIKIATDELNRVGLALDEYPTGSGYDDCFTKAYFFENVVVETFQRIGNTLANVVTKNQIQPLGQFKKFESPM